MNLAVQKMARAHCRFAPDSSNAGPLCMTRAIFVPHAQLLGIMLDHLTLDVSELEKPTTSALRRR